MEDVLLRALTFTKRFGGITALRGVDLELRAGEIHALMGENGAGKSAMAKIIAGVEQPDGGTLALLRVIAHNADAVIPAWHGSRLEPPAQS